MTGRPRTFNAAQASLLFEAQVQKRAAIRRIEQLLTKAGVLSKSARHQALRRNWLDRGVADVPREPKNRRET